MVRKCLYVMTVFLPFFFVDIDLSKGYYQAVLDLIDKFFDGDIDQTLFEEYTRYVFVTDAYLLFTIDKLVHTMIKQVKKKKKGTF